jgi:hypothetical protein
MGKNTKRASKFWQQGGRINIFLVRDTPLILMPLKTYNMTHFSFNLFKNTACPVLDFCPILGVLYL